MVLVDIYVPSINQTYDFQLDETMTIRMLTDEIVEMLQRKVSGHVEETKASFALCSYERQEVLGADRTLRECGIHNGSRLFLV